MLGIPRAANHLSTVPLPSRVHTLDGGHYCDFAKHEHSYLLPYMTSCCGSVDFKTLLELT